MSVDVVKQMDQARRLVEKGRIDEAIQAFQSVVSEAPNHLEAMQSLGDLFTMQNRPDRAAVYYGKLFDHLTGPREEPKALALYTRFLKSQQQPAERVARYALLLQKQGRAEEAIEQFTSAALAHELSGKGEDALTCFVRIAQLDSDNRDRHIAVAELAERLKNHAAASRGYLRAGQLTTQNDAEALGFFAKAHELAPNDRTTSLLYAQALLRRGEAPAAASLLAPLAIGEKDASYLEIYADALMRSGLLDDARTVLERIANQAAATGKLFSLAGEYLKAGQEDKGVDLLAATKKNMLAAKRESEFGSSLDQLVEAFPKSLALVKFWAAFYGEINREAKYFDALARLFDLSIETGQVAAACETFEKLVEIDAYDARNQQRFEQLQGRAPEEFLNRVKSRMSNAATHRQTVAPAAPAAAGASGEPSKAILEDVQSAQTLEDLLVQAEIFVQYSLQSKAIERLQRIVELFPGEEEHNERLQGLFEAAHWWPEEGVAASRQAARQPARAEEQPNRTATSPYAPETLRDLTKISEINQIVFRQPSPRAMLAVAVNEVGNYLRATRCLAVVGPRGQAPQMASEFCAPGIEASSGSQIVRLIGQIEHASPDPLGGYPLEAGSAILKEMGLESTLGVQLTDPETQAPAGMMIVGFAAQHTWKPNETYFLQSIGDQMLMCVHHTRLRTLVRTLAVADEKTGLLARGSYLDCLLNESQRARTQGIPLALALLQIDGGPELLRQQGEAPFDRFMEQLGKAVQAIVRQTDLAIKYTSWALAVVLPDTPLTGAQTFAAKLKKTVSGLRPPWDGGQLTMSVAVAEAVARQDYDNEDIVTDLINRVEGGLEEARKRGGNEIVALELVKN